MVENTDLAGRDQSANNFYPSYFAMQGSQFANVLSAKMLIGRNPPQFSSAKVLCHTVSYLLSHATAQFWIL